MSLDPRVKLRFELPPGGWGAVTSTARGGQAKRGEGADQELDKEEFHLLRGQEAVGPPGHVRGRWLLPFVASFHFFSSAGLGQEGRPRTWWSLVGRVPGQGSSVRDMLPFCPPSLPTGQGLGQPVAELCPSLVYTP